MYRLLLAAALAAAPVGTPVRADGTSDQLFSIGRAYCALSFAQDIGEFDSTEFLLDLVAMDYPQDVFCACVASEFREAGDDEMAAALRDEITEDDEYAMMASFLQFSMTSCMPDWPVEGGLGLDLGLSDDDLDFDLVDGDDSIEEALADNDFEADEGDVDACLMAFDDGLMLPGFDPVSAKARVRASRQTLGDVCGCAGGYIASLGEPFQLEVENAMNPAVVYGSSLAAGINMCIGD